MSVPKDPTSRAILFAFGVVLLTLMAALIWISRSSQHRERALAQFVFERRVNPSVHELRSCFDQFKVDGLALNGKWRSDSVHPGRISSSNAARHLTLTITDEGAFRLVKVETRSGRPLRLGEHKQIQSCLGST